MTTNLLLVNLIRNALEDKFIASKKHKYTGYSSFSCRDLFKHLIDTHVNTDELNLHESQARLDAPYDSDQPIE